MEKKCLINQLLLIEEAKDILEFKFSNDNQIMWPYIRYEFLEHSRVKLMEMNYKSEGISPLKYLGSMSLKNIIRYLHQLINGRKIKFKKKDILFATSNVYNTECVHGYWYNWLYDPYATIYKDDTMIIEKSYCFNFFLPRFFRDIKPYDGMFIISTVIGKFRKVPIEDKNKIKELIAYLKKSIAFELDERVYVQLENKLLDTCKKLPWESYYWNSILSKVQPKILFLDDGSYGGCSHIYRLAHKKKIVCCEFQHGLIGELHFAYNYNKTMIENNEYKECMPDYFLTFGEYWNSIHNSSSIPIIIGNPKTNNLKFKYCREISSKKKKIVFISDYLIAEFFVDLIIILIKEFNVLEKYDILLRPHPKDYNILHKYRELSKQTGVKIIEGETINRTLEYADAIVSEGSTVIFEALCYNVKILIRDTNSSQRMVPKGVGYRFKDAKELYEAFESINWEENLATDPNYFFDAKWEENYKAFISQILNTEE